MKKRLLTAWIIACMFICLVGQTPITALADGDDTRVISVPEGLQNVLINETPEVQTVETENTTEDIIEVPSEQTEIVDETSEVAPEQGEVIEENNETPTEQVEAVDENSEASNEQNETVEENNETPAEQVEAVNETKDVPNEQTEVVNENNEAPVEQIGEVVNGVNEAPVAQPEESAAPSEVVTETPAETPVAQNGNAVNNTPEYVEKTVEALLPEGTHNYGDIVRVSGLLPVDAIVEAIPVDVEIEGQIVLLAYDITIYENEEKKNAGISWQPEEGGLNVEFISSALEESEEEVNIWHMEDAEQNPEYITAAPSNDDSVEFVAESFSVYVVTETKLTATIIASDGNTYEINVTYDNKSGIPMEGTALKVDELKPGDDGYDEYIEESASKVGAKAEDLEFSKVFDIKIVDENDENTLYEPTGNVDVSIRVIGVSLSEYPQVNVLHFVEQRNAESYLIYDVAPTVKEETVEFTTDSFSVYVVIGHEGGTVENPRVMFHFIKDYISDPIGSGSSAYYAVDPYIFKNTNSENQTTQILKDGETLELIADPTNNSDKYFYGWYVVDPKVISGTTDAYGVGTSDNKLYYTWPENPNRISFETPISVSESGGTISWSLNGVSGSGTADSDGNAHVFLAPLFENYHFVNYMLRPKEDSSNNLMTRKLIALGSASSADVKISDVRANSTDPVHLVFIGWEYETAPGSNVWVSKQTLEYSGAPITETGKDGVYMTLDFTGRESINLYPVFIEARWVDFFAGVSGSGASYVPSRFLESWGYSGSEYALTPIEDKNYFSSLAKSTRPGYSFDGWYAFANTDHTTGEITNLYTPEDVEVTYLTISGGKYVTNTVTVNTKAVKIANGNGSIVNNSGTWKLTDNGDGTGTIDKDSGTYELFKIDDSKLYFYNPLDRLKLSAQWAPDDSNITVIYWTENVQDKNYTAPANPKDDYTASAVKVINTADLNTNLSTSYSSGSAIPLSELKNYTEGSVKVIDPFYLDDIGAVPAGEEKFYDLNESLSDASVVIKGDGSTTYNVYFERKTFKLVFHIGRDGYVKNSGQMKNASYPNWDGNWIEYMYKDSKVTSLGYTGKGNDSYSGVYSMSYGGKTYDSTYETWVLNPNTDHAQGNVMGDYVPGSDSSRIDNDANLYVIEAKYGAYIGDRWPSPTNPNFSFSNAAGSGKTLYIWTAYWDSLYAYIANSRPTSNNQGNNSDINGVHEYMSAELCTNRSGTGLINENQVHHLVAYFGEANNAKRFKRYHYLIEAIDGTYDSTIYQTVQGSDYTGYSRTTWSVQTGADSGTIADNEYYKLSDALVISNLEPEYQLGWELDGYDLIYSCYDNAQHPNTTNPSQKEYDIYFFYRPKQYTLTFNLGSSTISDNYYFNESLENANKYTDNVIVPEGYEFKGWYTNAEGVGNPFDFANEKMPGQNVVLYPYSKVLQYTVKIDPNGGELDHRSNSSVSTYFTADYGTPVGEYSTEREYIKLTDKELTVGDPKYYAGEKYYYINTQFLDIPEEGDWGYPIDLRNAVYVKESEFTDYYNEYCSAIANADPAWWTGISALSEADFKDKYTDYPYRPLYPGEHYTFMGWYQVHNGSVDSMPYNFNDPVNGPLELRAMWRLDGGYYVQYNPYYFDEENGNVTAVIGEIEGNSWTDPTNPSLELYADQSSMIILQAPTNVTSGWIFRGWRVVRKNGTKPFGNETYDNWEPFGDSTYYQPGDSFTIDSNLSTETTTYGNVIHMQAFYEKDTESVRRPEVTNLILDANDDYLGYISNIHSDLLPPLSGPGSQIINESSELHNGSPTQILIGDLQSNLALHLYRYATNKTINGVQGTNFFSHDNNYLLIGFDENADPMNPTTGKAFVPAFAADSVASVTRNETNKILYAMWEPMVYATFVNTTAEDLVIDLSGTGGTVSIVNKATGDFDRESATTTIVVPAKSGTENGEVKVVLPGAIPGTDRITATTTNTHIGYKLSVNGVFDTTDPYGTGSTDVYYNNQATYTGILQTDPTGIIITYSEEEVPSIVYDVNDGHWEETDPSFEQSSVDFDIYTIIDSAVNTIHRYKPADPTRTGKIFIGWTTNSDIAAQTDFGSASAVTYGNTTITPDTGEVVLDKVKSDYLWDFTQPAPYGQVLYAVWSDTVTVTFNVTRTGSNLHNWEGPTTTTTQEPYVYYRSSDTSANITYTLAKGERVPQPQNPTANTSGWNFAKWLLNNNSRTNATGLAENILTYAYDFSSPVTSNITLYTSWIKYEPQTFTFLVENQVVGGMAGEEFLYTIGVSEERVFGKLTTNNGVNGEGDPDKKWGSITTTLKNNEQYTVLITVSYYEGWGGDHSVWINVIDKDGVIVKSAPVTYLEKNRYKDYAQDYKYTLTISQEEKAGYTTTVTVDQVDADDQVNPTDTIDFTKDNASRSFTFKQAESREHNRFLPETNTYDEGEENSLRILFTNEGNFIPAPTNYSTNYRPFFMMFGFGAILIGLIVAPVVMLKRRKEEEE